MKTLVLGGGVVGVTTAYFLAKAGHEVTVVEEKDGVGLEASAGNAGIIAPGHSFAWASPRAPRMLWQSLRGAETAIRVRLGSDPRLYAWGLRFLRECTPERARRNTLIKLRLCQYSQRVMNELVRAEGIEYHAIAKGALYLHRDPAELDAGIKKMALLAEHGQKQEILDANALAQLDPVFEPVKGKIAGAIRDLGDSSGDSRLFVENLARRCQDALGVTVKLGARVTALRAEGDWIDGAVTNQGVLSADNYVLALGVGSAAVARTRGRGAAHLSGKGVLLHVPAAVPGPRAHGPRRRRAVAGRLVSARRPAAPDVDRRVRGLRLGLDAARLQQYPPPRPRPLSRRRRLRAGTVSRLSAPDDPGRPADPRPRPAPQPLPQLRPRPHGLDHGVRHRPHRGRPHDEPHARARPRRPHAAPLSLT